MRMLKVRNVKVNGGKISNVLTHIYLSILKYLSELSHS